MSDKLFKNSGIELGHILEQLGPHGEIVLTERTITITRGGVYDEQVTRQYHAQDNSHRLPNSEGDCSPCTHCGQTGFTTGGYIKHPCSYCTNGWVIKLPRPRF